VDAMTRFQNWFKRGWTRAVFDRNNDFEARQDCIVLDRALEVP